MIIEHLSGFAALQVAGLFFRLEMHDVNARSCCWRRSKRRLFSLPVAALGAMYLLASTIMPRDTFAQQPAQPCPPPSLSIVGGDAVATQECGTGIVPPVTSSDTEYGPQIPGNFCPDVPTSEADFTVTTEAQLNTALSALNGIGGMIQIQDGTYPNWGSVAISSGGTAQNPIYIRSQTLYGAVFTGPLQFDFTAPHVVLSGISKTGVTGTHFQIQADNIRLACSDIVGTSTPYTGNIVYIPHGGLDTYDDFELDNNKFRNMPGGSGPAVSIYRHNQCNTWSVSTCGGAHKRHHIHHNYVQGVNSPRSIAFYWGIGWGPDDENDPWFDPNNYSDHLFENNHITGWSTYNPLDIKVSRMTLRYNCWDGTRVPIIGRKGHDFLYYGNWHINTAGSEGYTDGWGAYSVFNYYNMSRPMFKIKSGTDGTDPVLDPRYWTYYSTSEGVLSNNVCDNCTHLVRTMDIFLTSKSVALTNPIHKPLAQNNRIQHNLTRSSGYVADYDPASDGHGYRTRAAFAAANTFDSNTLQIGAQKGNAACFTPGHVNGMGLSVPGSSRLSTFDGSLNYAITIPAPSWWQ